MIFISYRRTDSDVVAHRMFDWLVEQFGPGAVFIDIDTIPAGAHWREEIAKQVQAASVVLVVIGESWLDALRARAHDPMDVLRLEIETALAANKSIIPVLIERADMPASVELPPWAARLPEFNAARVSKTADFKVHMERLGRRLANSYGFKPTQQAKPINVWLAEWDYARSSNDIAEVRSFISRKPPEDLAVLASKALHEMVWHVSQGRIDALQAFLAEYPRSPKRREAEEQIKTLTDHERARIEGELKAKRRAEEMRHQQEQERQQKDFERARQENERRQRDDDRRQKAREEAALLKARRERRWRLAKRGGIAVASLVALAIGLRFLTQDYYSQAYFSVLGDDVSLAFKPKEVSASLAAELGAPRAKILQEGYDRFNTTCREGWLNYCLTMDQVVSSVFAHGLAPCASSRLVVLLGRPPQRPCWLKGVDAHNTRVYGSAWDEYKAQFTSLFERSIALRKTADFRARELLVTELRDLTTSFVRTTLAPKFMKEMDEAQLNGKPYAGADAIRERHKKTGLGYTESSFQASEGLASVYGVSNLPFVDLTEMSKTLIAYEKHVRECFDTAGAHKRGCGRLW